MVGFLGDSKLYWVYILRFQQQSGYTIGLCKIRDCPHARHPVSGGSKTDQLLAKAEAISESAGVSVTTYFKKIA